MHSIFRPACRYANHSRNRSERSCALVSCGSTGLECSVRVIPQPYELCILSCAFRIPFFAQLVPSYSILKPVYLQAQIDRQYLVHLFDSSHVDARFIPCLVLPQTPTLLLLRVYPCTFRIAFFTHLVSCAYPSPKYIIHYFVLSPCASVSSYFHDSSHLDIQRARVKPPTFKDCVLDVGVPGRLRPRPKSRATGDSILRTYRMNKALVRFRRSTTILWIVRYKMCLNLNHNAHFRYAITTGRTGMEG